METGSYDVFGLSHQEIECTDPASVEKTLKRVRPDVVVNCAAFAELTNLKTVQTKPFASTAWVRSMWHGLARRSMHSVFTSAPITYFDGEKGISIYRDDAPHPINVYGVSKLAGKYLVQEACPRWLIARMASLFGKAGSSGKGGNFVNHLGQSESRESLRLVDDIRMSPTYTRDGAQLGKTLREGSLGLFHWRMPVIAPGMSSPAKLWKW